ncbi:MAG TPA: efflux RND transporter periplasmic adaptor subunit [Polyangiaceae bacterium]|nr:efflux RND transporter periplasmic adaptor subunit [Polyangiaceae bacterium]
MTSDASEGSEALGAQRPESAPPPQAHVERAAAARRFGVGTLVAAMLATAAVSSVASIVTFRALSARSASGTHSDAEAPLYQCPMHPSIIQDHPGDCPICGMKLVRVASATLHKSDSSTALATKAEPSAAPAVPGMAAVEIDANRQQLIGLKTAEVLEGSVGGAWRTVGRVAVDETRVRHVNLKVAGFVEHVYVDYVGKKVNKGDPLFSIYSPDLLAAQQEYLVASKLRTDLAKLAQNDGATDTALLAAARRKLELWDIPTADLEKLERTREATRTLTLRSPVSGVVTKKDVVDGMKLDAGAMPYEIVDLSTVWVLADVYESELRFVKEGMAATLTLAAFPNREFKGKVVFLDPLLDAQTRTVKVRLNFPNPSGELRPEMFGEVVLLGPPRQALRIPTDAVIDSGTERVVFVAVGEGKFEPRPVKVGESDGANIEIVSGLKAGERVVVRANFLVDSESRLRASLQAIAPASSANAPESARVLPQPTSPSPNRAEPPSPAAAPPRDTSGTQSSPTPHSGHDHGAHGDHSGHGQ